MKPHHRFLPYALLFIMNLYIPQQNLPVRVGSHPRANYIMYKHTPGLRLTSDSLPVFTFFPTACWSAFWEHISSRLKNKVIPNLKSLTLKRFSRHESSNGDQAVKEMAIGLLHGKDSGLTCTRSICLV